MKKLIFVLLCIILLATNGCRFHFTEVPVENSAYVVTDELGRTVKIPHKPQRIVSATYGFSGCEPNCWSQQICGKS